LRAFAPVVDSSQSGNVGNFVAPLERVGEIAANLENMIFVVSPYYQACQNLQPSERSPRLLNNSSREWLVS
jgi:hypothetical protein